MYLQGKPVMLKSGRQVVNKTVNSIAAQKMAPYLKILETPNAKSWLGTLTPEQLTTIKKQIANQKITLQQLRLKINVHYQLTQLKTNPQLLKWFNTQTAESKSAIIDMIKSGYLTTSMIKKIDQAALNKSMRMLSQEKKFLDSGAGERYRMFLDRVRGIQIKKADPNLGAASPVDATASVGIGRSLTTNKKLTLKQIKYITSHELDHMYNNTPAEARDWSKAFDLSKINDPRGRTQRYFRTPNKTSNASIEKTDKSFDLGIDSRYDSFNELRARAGQLKDYISMKRGIPLNKNFKVTMTDLNYAIKNYIKDVGLDNQMSAFFNALTDKNHLLKCMNKYALGTAGLISIGILSNTTN